MSNRLFAVVVLYNKTISDSLTCHNLKKIKNHKIDILIVDNSTIEMNNEKFASYEDWMYITMHGNSGLSKAYNRVLDILKDEDGIVIWFDDDTNITQDYFDELSKIAIEKKEINIFVPVIFGQDGRIYSPNESRFFRNKQLKKFDDTVNVKKFNAINSCTAVRLKVYKKYRYDERLFLDQVDHKFFEDQRKIGCTFCKLNVIIHHNFSLKSKQSTPQQCWKRYETMIPDFLIFCGKTKPRLVLGIIKVTGWGLREAINYKYPLFIVWCIKYSLAFVIKVWKEK